MWWRRRRARRGRRSIRAGMHRAFSTTTLGFHTHALIYTALTPLTGCTIRIKQASQVLYKHNPTHPCQTICRLVHQVPLPTTKTTTGTARTAPPGVAWIVQQRRLRNSLLFFPAQARSPRGVMRSDLFVRVSTGRWGLYMYPSELSLELNLGEL